MAASKTASKTRPDHAEADPTPDPPVAPVTVESRLATVEDALLADDAPPPDPTAYRAAWWPAAVTLPDGTHFRLARVYATREGLYVYDGVDHLAHFAPIDYGKTARPADSYPANRKAARIITADGGVILVQRLGGCGCGHPLKHWRPNWSNRHEAWEG